VEGREQEPARVIVVMGVSGSGKTTVGRLLAQRLGWIFADADDDHSPQNVEKMRAGRGLDETDRLPWLEILRARVAEWLVRGDQAVLACSALTRASRQLLRVDPQRVAFVHLAGSKQTIFERMARRAAHFMPSDLLDGQLAALETPGPEEALEVSTGSSPEETVDEICSRLGLG
jgi:gluconokinase